MGYLFMVIALFSGAVKGYCGKKTSSSMADTKDAMLANTLRMLFCIVIGFTIVAFQDSTESLKISRSMLLISLLSGISTSVFVVSWLISVKKGAYMMLDVFLTLGTLIPMCLSSLLFSEQIKPTQWIGLAILLISVIIMCSYNNSIKEKMSIASFLLLVLCGAANGFADFSQKLFVKSESGFSSAVFNFYTYVFSAAVLLICFIFLSSKAGDTKSSAVKIKSVFGYILIMSLCLFLNSYFKTLAAAHIPAAQLYPLMQGAALILSTFMSAIFFKEKPTAKCILGIVIAFVGLIFINVM